MKYIVAPAVMVVKGVLPGSQGPLMYEDEDTSAATFNWNGMPLTYGHPYHPTSG